MKPATPTTTIQLSATESITVNVITDIRNAVGIDTSLDVADLDDFWIELEHHCVAGCCGLDAFNFLEDAVQAAATCAGVEKVSRSLQRATARIEQEPIEVLVSSRLNHVDCKNNFLKLLRHLSACVDRISPQ